MRNSTHWKFVYVLLDGVGDLPHPILDNMTPLEAASTPNIDSLARNGCMGNVITVGQGIAPQSDIAVFNMLGYNFQDGTYFGRGVVESIGAGIDFREGDLALRGNFATVGDDPGAIVDRRAGRSVTAKESMEVCSILNKHIRLSDKGASCMVKSTISHRVIIRFRHNLLPLSNQITNTDPAYDNIGGIGVAKPFLDSQRLNFSIPLDDTEAAKISAKMLNEFTDQTTKILKNHPINSKRLSKGQRAINAILARDAGNRYPHIEPMRKKFGLSMGCIVDMPVEVGISKILGMTSFQAGDMNDYRTKARMAANKISEFDGMYVHLKGPDEYGHDGDAEGKKNIIEIIDQDFFGTLLGGVDLRNIVIIISGDHSTPCIKKAHTDDPVPLLFSGANVQRDDSPRFTEYYGSKGSKGLLMGNMVIPLVLDVKPSSFLHRPP
jgi:2,3-bisphosphoglycerate-independent phosphoglycerate mutase